MVISAIILAAGKSERMGKPKLLLPVKGKPMFVHPIERAIEAELAPVFIIGGQYFDLVKEAMPRNGHIKAIFNPDYAKGLSTSLQKGINAVKNSSDATMVFLGDQPLIPPNVVQELIQNFKLYRHKRIKIVRPRYGGRHGHPILFSSELFSEFEGLSGDQGGKSIIKRYKEYVREISYSIREWGMDVDTEKDYKKIITLSKKQAF